MFWSASLPSVECVQHDSFVFATWNIRICDVKYLCMRHDYVYAAWLESERKAVDIPMGVYAYTSQICERKHSYLRRDTFVCAAWLESEIKVVGTGWRRLIGCIKLQIIFRKRATNYTALLRKMTYKDKASYDSTPPCIPMGVEIGGIFECVYWNVSCRTFECVMLHV